MGPTGASTTLAGYKAPTATQLWKFVHTFKETVLVRRAVFSQYLSYEQILDESWARAYLSQ